MATPEIPRGGIELGEGANKQFGWSNNVLSVSAHLYKLRIWEIQGIRDNILSSNHSHA